MMPTEIALTLASTIGLFLIWYLCSFCFREYLIDSFREALFALRDELFNYAASVDLPFDDERHMALRNFINTTIRFSHKLTFFRVVLSQVSKTEYPEMYKSDPMQRWVKSLDDLPKEQRERLLSLQARLLRTAVIQMTWRSPFLIPVVIFYKLGTLASEATFRPLKRLAYQKIQLGLMEQQAEEEGTRSDTRRQLAAV